MAKKSNQPVTPLPGAEVRRQFADKVYKAMIGKGWYQSELARRSGLTRDQISTYVRGKALPESESLVKLAGALDVPPEELLPQHPAGRGPVTMAATEFRSLPGAKGKVWLHVDRAIGTATALKIVELIEKDEHANGA